MSAFAPIRRFLRLLTDTVLPPRCIGSGEIVEAPGTVSPAFWQELHFIEAPFCPVCGIPFSFDIAAGSLCAACIAREPVFDRARAALTYNDASRKLVLGFKYGDMLHSVQTFAPWMMRAGAEMIAESDLLIPVPLSRQRLRKRRFNQSALLAREIAKRAGKSYLADALLRTRDTLPQKGLSADMRDRNVRGAFAVGDKRLDDVKGRHILLIDDVYTTGATLNECARTLKTAGASAVDVLTIARVTLDDTGV